MPYKKPASKKKEVEAALLMVRLQLNVRPAWLEFPQIADLMVQTWMLVQGMLGCRRHGGRTVQTQQDSEGGAIVSASGCPFKTALPRTGTR
eukprot:1653137-Pleurochrysis_carterae.AAC.2